MHHHGRYWRTAVTGRRVYRIPIYRWCCVTHGGTVSLLPDFLVPYAQFVSLVREGVMRRWLRNWPMAKLATRACLAVAGGLSERTVARWLVRVKQLACDWCQVLADRLLVARPGADLSAPDLHRQGPKAQLQTLCHWGDRCRRQAPSSQGHPGLYAYCGGLLTGLRRL
jgi:hypothetical protein